MTSIVWHLGSRLIQKAKTEDLHQAAPRPRYGGLIIDKVQQTIQTKALSVEEGLRVMKQQMSSL